MRVLSVVLGSLVVALSSSVMPGVGGHVIASVDAPADAGDVTLVSFQDPSTPLLSAGSATVFLVRLPDDAVCPGDSTHDQWRTQSFVVPSDVDPGTLRYTVVAPEGQGRYALYDVETRPYINALLYPNDGPGKPGLIPSLPPMSFAVFPPGTLADGRYRLGIACTYFRQTARYWDAEIEIVNDGRDQPARLTWNLPEQAPFVVATEPGFAWWPWPVLGGALATLIVVGPLTARAGRRIFRAEAPTLETSPRPPQPPTPTTLDQGVNRDVTDQP